MARRKNTYFDEFSRQKKSEQTGPTRIIEDELKDTDYIEVLDDGEDATVTPLTKPEKMGGEIEETPPGQDGHTLKGLVFAINEVPAWYMCIFLGLQQFFAMFGTVVAIVMQLAPSLCLANDIQGLSGLLATTFFCSGIATLLQSLIGVRLPVVSAASFTYIVPVMAILAKSPDCTTSGMTGGQPTGMPDTTENYTSPDLFNLDASYQWKTKICEIQCGILIASLIEILIGLSGVVGFILQWVGPLTLTATMTLIGLQLFAVASDRASQQWGFALAVVFLIALLSQFNRNLVIPACRFKRGKGCTRENMPIILMFPILLAVVVTWIIHGSLEAAGTIERAEPTECDSLTYFCNNTLQNTSWFRVPYPFQYGAPIFTAASVTGIIAAVIASIVESIGDFYACARISSAPSLPLHALNRGIAVQGMGTLIFGMFGCPMGNVSYTENVGAIGTTKVASRRVIQVTAIIMLVFGVFTKFNAVFVVVPDPIKGGVLIVLFGMVTGIGISNLQFVDLNSTRNLFILGFSLFFGITLPEWVSHHRDRISLVQGQSQINEIIRILLSTGMFVGGLSAMVLDNTIPGTAKERGILAFKNCKGDTVDEMHCRQDIYGFPIFKNFFDQYEWARFVPFLPTFDESLIKIKKRSSKHNKYKVNAPS